MRGIGLPTLRSTFHPGTAISRERDQSSLEADVWTDMVAQNCLIRMNEVMTAVPATEWVVW